MTIMAANFKTAALVSFMMVLPFALLETAFGSGRKDPAGLSVLFGVLWLLPTTFMLVVLPMVRNASAGGHTVASPIALLFKSAVLVVLAAAWVSLAADQAPCFIGVPNCD